LGFWGFGFRDIDWRFGVGWHTPDSSEVDGAAEQRGEHAVRSGQRRVQPARAHQHAHASMRGVLSRT